MKGVVIMRYNIIGKNIDVWDKTKEMVEKKMDRIAKLFPAERLVCCLGIDAFAFRLFLRQIASISQIRETLSQSQLERLGPLLEDKELMRRIQEADINMALCDKSHLGRMRDFYPIELFTMSNLVRLLDGKLYPDAFYFTVFTLLLLAIRGPFFNMELRLRMFNLVFLLLRHQFLPHQLHNNMVIFQQPFLFEHLLYSFFL